MSRDVQVFSSMFKSVQRCSEVSRGIYMYGCSELFKGVWRYPDMSRGVLSCSKVFGSTQTCLEVSRVLQQYLEVSRHEKWCPEFFKGV